MNSEKKKIIDDIIQGKSSRIRENYFENNYNSTYMDIKSYTFHINIPFIQKIWHWVNDFPTEYKCSCGKPTTFNRNWLDGYKKGCSAKCIQNHPETKDKRKKTTLERYGVDNIAKLDETKKKMEKTNLATYGTKSSFQNEEVRDKWRENIKSKYGVDHVFQLEKVKDKIKETNLEKYGKEHYTQTEEYILKSKVTNQQRYGADWFSQTQEYVDKVKESNQKMYGVDWYLQSDEIRNILKNNQEEIQEKIRKTSLEKYGKEHYTQTEQYKEDLKSLNLDYDIIQEKARKTSLEKYGKEYYTQTNEWIDRMVKHNQEKFGQDWYFQTEEAKLCRAELQVVLNQIMIEKSKEYYNNLGFELIKINGDFVELNSNKCNHNFFVKRGFFYKRIIYNVNPCIICNPLSTHQSGKELELIDWLRSLNLELVIKDRKICNGYELDVYIPSHSIALEFNGLYWHSEYYKEKNYHLNKTDLCIKKGINLIHIWEDDWNNKKEIVKSIILNRLNLISNKIYARKCEIKIVDTQQATIFLNTNHIQGSSRFSKAYGLYYNNELVSLMSFGFRNINSSLEYELIRFCNKIDINIVGAASRLFSFFLKNNIEINQIISYADISIFTGSIYKILDFKFSHRSVVNSWWVVDDKRIHRLNYNKKKLVKDGFDPNLSVNEIMYSVGAYRIFGCGQEKWIYKRN